MVSQLRMPQGTLTPTEMQYAQVQKELLAIVFVCEQFEAYMYGRDVVQVETIHQPLDAIVQKPLHNAPSRLQWMLLQLQKFNIKVRYKRSKIMFLADTRTRAHLAEVHVCSELENIDHTASLAMPTRQLEHRRESCLNRSRNDSSEKCCTTRLATQ